MKLRGPLGSFMPGFGPRKHDIFSFTGPAQLRPALLDAKTGWGPAHQLGPRGPQTDYEPLRPTSSLSARLGPQTYWETLDQLGAARPTGSRSTNWEPLGRLGAAQTDWDPLRPIVAP